MLLVEYNEKIKAIRKPDNYEDFKKKVIEEYFLPCEKIQNIFFTYRDEENNSIYVTNEEDFFYAINLVGEEIVFNIEFKENENKKKESSIDSLLAKGNIDDIIERTNKRIIELKKETNEDNKKLRSRKKKLPDIHKDIICNECKNDIIGIRYKCCICENYNLCEKCENESGPEHNHPLLKIRKPELCPSFFSCRLK